jgi:hypothetical protein
VIRRAWDLLLAFGRFWYDFIVGDDWMAAAGVVVMLGGAWVLIQAGVPAWWFGPLVIVTTAAITVRRALRSNTDEC